MVDRFFPAKARDRLSWFHIPTLKGRVIQISMDKWFTRQERGVILFLVACIVVGACIYIYKTKNPVFAPELKFTYSKASTDIGEVVVKTKDSPEQNIIEKVNINTALKDELVSLPGIGPVYAQRIIEYREKTRGFKTIEEIMNIRGIGEKKFEKLKDRITVK